MPVQNIAAISLTLALTILLPLGGMLYLRRRGGTWTEFLIGAGTFVLFAMFLEPLLHNLVLRSGAGAAIQGNILLYALYGGIAAGVFEETGRLLAFRLILKNRRGRITALSCGIGHGGMEAFLLVGLTMAANLALALGAGSAALSPEASAALETLNATPASLFLWSGVERISAMTLHMANSVLVFTAVRTKKRWLYPCAVLTHAAVNFAAVASSAHLPVPATEVLVLALAAAVAVWAAGIYKKLPENTENS